MPVRGSSIDSRIAIHQRTGAARREHTPLSADFSALSAAPTAHCSAADDALHSLTWHALPTDVILFADEPVLIEHVELLAGGELFSTDKAGEALEVEHLVSRLPHQVLW